MAFNFDYSSMMKSQDLIDGIGTEELNELENIFQAARKDLQERRSSGELPFWDLPFNQEMIDDVLDFKNKNQSRFTDFVHLGIGGSALGSIALHSTLNHLQHNLLPKDKRKGCRFFCPDNVDPDLIGSVLDVIDVKKSLFHIVTKSGGTAETISQFMLVVDILKKQIGDNWSDHLAITTDPEKGFMRKFANDHGVRTFPIEPKVGGRFTVLTPVGLLPAAMTGIDVAGLCRGARQVGDYCFKDRLTDNPAALLAALFFLADKEKKRPIHIFFAYSNRLYLISDWFRQLWAESLGKKLDLNENPVFRGATPVKAVGATDQHSQVQLYVEGPRDKAVLFLGVKEFADKLEIPAMDFSAPETDYLGDKNFEMLLNSERRATEYALTKSGQLNMSLVMDRIDPAHIGALLYLLEGVVLYAGAFYHVNPLDQPGVEAGKRATYALMGRDGFSGEREKIESFYSDERQAIDISL